MSFAKHLGLPDLSGEGDDNKGILSAPFAWLMFMHSMILGDSDAGKTWVVLNILLHEASPFLPAYEKIVVIGSEPEDAGRQARITQMTNECAYESGVNRGRRRRVMLTSVL